ncbi:hypothetical protein RI129_001509 [Pyrocoelia pectoralis]|uniref:Helix-turn-helix domain-containing protein n=1 Tax=Pyrocoelia pectoralis TaxID=417401 RepID=A0AAN7VYI1_9COLE
MLIERLDNGTFKHKLYRKITHSNRYLNAQSHHHPCQLYGIIKSLTIRSIRLSDEESKNDELEKLTKMLQQNGYPLTKIKSIIKKYINEAQKSTKTVDEPKKLVVLPYIKGVTDTIGNKFPKNQFRVVYKPINSLRQFLRNAKDQIPGESQGIYEVPCDGCIRSYIGQTNRRLNVRAQEHQLAIKQHNTSSSLATHRLETGHHIDTGKIKLLAPAYTLQERIIREAIEIEKRPLALNKRDDTSRIPSVWKLVIRKHETPLRENNTNEDSDQQITSNVLKVVIKKQNVQNVQASTSNGPMTRSRSRMNALQN